MNERVNNQHNIDEHGNQQFQLIEHTIKALLAGITPEDLTTSQRLNFAAKLLLPYVRMLTLQYTIQRARQSASGGEAFLDDLRQRMRINLEEMIKGEYEE